MISRNKLRMMASQKCLNAFVERCYSVVPRHPVLYDKVKLAVGLKELNGLVSGETVEVIAFDQGDNLPYRIKLPNLEMPWMPAHSLQLADPNSFPPPPRRPDSNACCGSSCENCVWILYRKALKEYKTSFEKS
eukprot:Awhi_evm2s14369